jgi:hypothetical protein
MKFTTYVVVATALFCIPMICSAKDAKTYKHASQYQIATLDQNLRVQTGYDITVAKSMTDAKLAPGGQGIHLLYTEQGNYRVEAPVNKGRSFGLALATAMANSNRPYYAQEAAATIHNKWFMDNVQPGTKVLFASECAKPNRKHPNDTVRCTFWFPDPDSTDHEYETAGDFTPFLVGSGSNMQKTADTLCGSGKLRPEVEAQLCAGTLAQIPAPATPSPVPAAVTQQ